MLLDLKGKPAANQALDWGRRIFIDEEQQISMTCFAPKVMTDANGPVHSSGPGRRSGVRDLPPEGQRLSRGRCRSTREARVSSTWGRSAPAPIAEVARGREEMSSFRKNAPGAGEVAPPIEATTLDGKPLKLDDFKGKYVLLDFWATWCGPCIGEIPQLQAVHDAFGKDERFAILSLSVDEKIEEPQEIPGKTPAAVAAGFSRRRHPRARPPAPSASGRSRPSCSSAPTARSLPGECGARHQEGGCEGAREEAVSAGAKLKGVTELRVCDRAVHGRGHRASFPLTACQRISFNSKSSDEVWPTRTISLFAREYEKC